MAVETAVCAVCDEEVPLDGEQAGEIEGRVLCVDCLGEPVAFRAECERFDCSWSYEREDRESNRLATENLVRNAANQHEKRKRVFDGGHGHHATVKEVQP